MWAGIIYCLFEVLLRVTWCRCFPGCLCVCVHRGHLPRYMFSLSDSSPFQMGISLQVHPSTSAWIPSPVRQQCPLGQFYIRGGWLHLKWYNFVVNDCKILMVFALKGTLRLPIVFSPRSPMCLLQPVELRPHWPVFFHASRESLLPVVLIPATHCVLDRETIHWQCVAFFGLLTWSESEWVLGGAEACSVHTPASSIIQSTAITGRSHITRLS